MLKFKLLYFKSLLDIAFIKFFDEYNDLFKNVDGIYILAKDINIAKLVKIFKNYISSVLISETDKFDILQPTYYLIIGGCMPKNNLLLQYKDDKYFPKKLDKLIQSDFDVKYILKEKDIKLDMIRFNNVCINVFNEFFKSKQIVLSKNIDASNIIFIQHKNLDCYILFKLIKHILGRNNCINFFEERFKDIKSPIIAINDLIDKYVNKNLLNKSQQLKTIENEIKQYISQKISLKF